MKTIPIFLRVILFGLIPAFLIYVGKDDFLIDKLIKNTQFISESGKQEFMFYSFLIGIVWSAALNPITYAIYKTQYQKRINKYEGLMSYFKDHFIKFLKRELNLPNEVVLNVRLFFVRKTLIDLFFYIFRKEKTLHIKHIEGLCDKYHSDDLSFKVSNKKQEGMVGRAYTDRKIFVDLNLRTQNTYTLTRKQVIQVQNEEFCTVIPVFKKNSEKVRCVLSIDSVHKLNLMRNDINILRNNLSYFAAIVEKNIS